MDGIATFVRHLRQDVKRFVLLAQLVEIWAGQLPAFRLRGNEMLSRHADRLATTTEPYQQIDENLRREGADLIGVGGLRLGTKMGEAGLHLVAF